MIERSGGWGPRFSRDPRTHWVHIEVVLHLLDVRRTLFVAMQWLPPDWESSTDFRAQRR